MQPAMSAAARRVFQLIAVLALAGVAGGYVLSRVAVRFLEHLLFGIRSTDPVTFAATAGMHSVANTINSSFNQIGTHLGQYIT